MKKKRRKKGNTTSNKNSDGERRLEIIRNNYHSYNGVAMKMTMGKIMGDNNNNINNNNNNDLTNKQMKS